MTKKEILTQLTEWKENIDYDTKSTWIEDQDRQEYIRQSTQLAMMIGLLYALGDNNNIDNGTIPLTPNK